MKPKHQPIICKCLATGAFCLMNGLVGSAVFAADSSVDIEVNIAPVLNISVPQPEPINITASTINALQTTNITADVATNNPTGYTLTMSSTTTDLVNSATQIGGEYPVIPTLQANVSSSNFTANHWGISFDNGSNYQPFTTSHQFTPTTGPANHSYTNLKAGVKVGLEAGAGTYTNTINFAAVANEVPETRTLADITYMQEINPEICANTTIATNDSEQYQLQDTRDNKLYWVAKLADGNCWMTQNLDLDLDSTRTYTPADTDITTNWTPSTSTYATGSSTWSDSSTAPESYDPGELCWTGESSWADLDDIAESCTPEEAEAHYQIGNYYNWAAATAETGPQNNDAILAIEEAYDNGEYSSAEELLVATVISGVISEQDAYILGVMGEQMGLDLETSWGYVKTYMWASHPAPSSICPAGWRLPSINTFTDFVGYGLSTDNIPNDFQNLVSQYDWNSSSGYMEGYYSMLDAPLSFVLGGYWVRYSGFAGFGGGYWSSVAITADNAFQLVTTYGDKVTPNYYDDRGRGYSVRCVAHP